MERRARLSDDVVLRERLAHELIRSPQSRDSGHFSLLLSIIGHDFPDIRVVTKHT